MDKFGEQFQQELDDQEMKSNQYTLMGFTWFIVVVGLIWVLTIIDFFEIDKILITIAFAVNMVLFVVARWIGKTRDLSERWIKYAFLTLICIGAAVIAAFLSFHAQFAFIIPMIIAIQYRRKDIIWFAYVVNMVTMLISSFISFYYGICDLNLLYESNHVRSWYLEKIASGTWTPRFNENPVFIILVFEVLPRGMILLAFSAIIQYVVISSNEDAKRIAQLTYLKETDLGTQVFNKNKYNEMVADYYPRIDKIAVLFWDLNHLKEINDQYGHSVGDRAIQMLSSVLNTFANNRCRIYRVGGDEFLMVLDNPKEKEAKQLIEVIRNKIVEENQRIAQESGIDIIQISSAVGYARGYGVDILDVVKSADKNMYIDKKSMRENSESTC